MPKGDGMGPMGTGPMTGRAAGSCASYATPGFTNPVRGRGMGLGMGCGKGAAEGRGGGFGFRNRYFANGVQQTPVMTADQEKEYIQNNVKALENELEAAKKRLSAMNEK